MVLYIHTKQVDYCMDSNKHNSSSSSFTDLLNSSMGSDPPDPNQHHYQNFHQPPYSLNYPPPNLHGHYPHGIPNPNPFTGPSSFQQFLSTPIGYHAGLYQANMGQFLQGMHGGFASNGLASPVGPMAFFGASGGSSSHGDESSPIASASPTGAPPMPQVLKEMQKRIKLNSSGAYSSSTQSTDSADVAEISRPQGRDAAKSERKNKGKHSEASNSRFTNKSMHTFNEQQLRKTVVAEEMADAAIAQAVADKEKAEAFSNVSVLFVEVACHVTFSNVSVIMFNVISYVQCIAALYSFIFVLVRDLCLVPCPDLRLVRLWPQQVCLATCAAVVGNGNTTRVRRTHSRRQRDDASVAGTIRPSRPPHAPCCVG